MLESAIEAKVVRFCRDRGYLCYKFSSPAHRGVPDRLIMHDGRAMFLELKREGQTPTPLQRREIERLNKCGVYATWADSTQSAIEKIEDFFAL